MASKSERRRVTCSLARPGESAPRSIQILDSCRLTVVIIEQSTEASQTSHCSCFSSNGFHRNNEGSGANFWWVKRFAGRESFRGL